MSINDLIAFRLDTVLHGSAKKQSATMALFNELGKNDAGNSSRNTSWPNI